MATFVRRFLAVIQHFKKLAGFLCHLELLFAPRDNFFALNAIWKDSLYDMLILISSRVQAIH